MFYIFSYVKSLYIERVEKHCFKTNQSSTWTCVPDGLLHRLADNVWRGSRLGEGCEADYPFHRFIIFTTGAQQVKKCGQENHLYVQRDNKYLKSPLNIQSHQSNCACVSITRDRTKLSSAVPLWNSTVSSVVVVDISKPTFRLITTHRDSKIYRRRQHIH